MTQEVGIKYKLNFQHAPAPAEDILCEIKLWRDRLHQTGLIGITTTGIGFGNISIRIPDSKQFIISGAMTGGLTSLEAKHYVTVTNYEIDQNTVFAAGAVEPSSEALTHAACYQGSTEIRAVIHVHYRALWELLIKTGPATSPDALYGSVELAKEISALHTNFSGAPRLVGMAGHQDGIIVAGRSLSEIGELLLGRV